jgi:hypothetical protein
MYRGPSKRRHLLRALRLAQDDVAWRVSLKWTTVVGQSHAKLGSGGIHREGVRIAGIADIARHRRNREGPRLTVINSAGTDRETGLSGNRNIGNTGNQEIRWSDDRACSGDRKSQSLLSQRTQRETQRKQRNTQERHSSVSG